MSNTTCVTGRTVTDYPLGDDDSVPVFFVFVFFYSAHILDVCVVFYEQYW